MNPIITWSKDKGFIALAHDESSDLERSAHEWRPRTTKTRWFRKASDEGQNRQYHFDRVCSIITSTCKFNCHLNSVASDERPQLLEKTKSSEKKKVTFPFLKSKFIEILPFGHASRSSVPVEGEKISTTPYTRCGAYFFNFQCETCVVQLSNYSGQCH